MFEDGELLALGRRIEAHDNLAIVAPARVDRLDPSAESHQINSVQSIGAQLYFVNLLDTAQVSAYLGCRMPKVFVLESKPYAISVRFTSGQERALRAIAVRDQRTIADSVRHLTEQALRQRGPDIRKLLDGDVVDAR